MVEKWLQYVNRHGVSKYKASYAIQVNSSDETTKSSHDHFKELLSQLTTKHLSHL